MCAAPHYSVAAGLAHHPPCRRCNRAPVQLVCPGASTDVIGDPVTFTTGWSNSSVPMLGASSRVMCNLTLTLTDAYQFSGTTTTSVMVRCLEGSLDDMSPTRLCARYGGSGSGIRASARSPRKLAYVVAAWLRLLQARGCAGCSATTTSAPPAPILRAQVSPPAAPVAVIAGANATTHTLIKIAAGDAAPLNASGTTCGGVISNCTYTW